MGLLTGMWKRETPQIERTLGSVLRHTGLIRPEARELLWAALEGPPYITPGQV